MITEHRVRLTRVANGSALRTSDVDGVAGDLPEVGSSFVMFAKSLDPELDMRVVSTSEVRSVEELGPGVSQFTTLNSTYRLEVLEAA